MCGVNNGGSILEKEKSLRSVRDSFVSYPLLLGRDSLVLTKFILVFWGFSLSGFSFRFV